MILSRLKNRLIPAKQPEQSLLLRGVILAAMLVPLLAIARVSSLGPHAVLAGLGIGVGHWYSYQTRERPNQLVRGVMFLAIHLVLAWMIIGLATGATVPQAQFAIFTQAITSFDLRYRTSLFNTLIHSLANLYIAASLSRTSELVVYLILFAGLVLAAFYVAEQEDGLKLARLRPGPTSTRPATRRSGLLIFGAGFVLIFLISISVAFIFTPRFASRPIVPPFTINVPLRGGVKSEIINPGIPVVQINGWSDDSSDYFYGFDTDLDLRYRGGLSNEIVMYVRSPSRSYWRSHSYDFYTGVSWQQSDQRLIDIPGHGGVYFELLPPLGAPVAGPARTGRAPGPPRHVEELFGSTVQAKAEQQIVQSFTMLRDQPNLIFAAYRPAEVFIVTEQLSVDSGDGIRVPEPLKAGLTYSVVSYRPEFNPELLRQATTDYPAEISRRYLQLPGNISDRVKQLARTLTAPYGNNYDKVMALNQHLLSQYPYNFFPPPHPPGAEVVDTFLFEDQEGVCEQYVTALVVMARTLGIPARLATGYGSGDYNGLTGYYEVRLNHAHSWAEVYFSGYGWVPFDPTPGWTPQPYPTPVQSWLFSNMGKIPGLNIPAGALISGSITGLVKIGPFLALAAVVVGLTVLAVYLGKRLSLLSGRRARPAYTPSASNRTRRLILALYQRGVRFMLRRKYRQRRPWETLSEYARDIGSLPALLELTRIAEIAAYRPEAPDERVVAEAEAALVSLETELAAKKSAER
jgi:transglutaminase-like putative cysteine protease